MAKQRLLYKANLVQASHLALIEEARLLAMPRVLLALIVYLRIHSSDIALHLGVSRPTLSNWASGRYPIPTVHHQRLVALLRAAVKAGDMIITCAPPDIVHAVPKYTKRVTSAWIILQRLEDEQG